MNRRYSIPAGILLVVLVSGLGWVAIRCWMSRDRPASVLLITLDTTRADRLGCYGYDRAATPALDALAREGIRFTRAYSHVPLTLPSHATLFTGLLPPEHGLRDNGRGGLNPAIPTLAESFRAHGFRTAAFVASFTVDKRFGLNRGFDVYDDRMKPAAKADELLEMENTADVVSDRALAWLAALGGEPFFCWVHFYDPHTPYTPPEPYRSRHNDPYDGEMAFMDAQIRRLIEFLDSRGLGRRVMIFVCGDHGESFGEHREDGHGQFVYNATLHVPLLIRLPERAGAGSIVDRVVGLEDIAPTVLRVMGWKRPPSMRGQDLLREAPDERYCYGESQSPYFTFGWSPLYSLMSSRWKYIQCPAPEFYDLRNDPGETTNLFAALPGPAGEYAARLERMRQAMDETRASPVAIDARAAKTLRSLGYAVGGSATAPKADAGNLKDPKAMMDVYDACYTAGKLMEKRQPREAIERLAPLVAGNAECGQLHELLARCYSDLRQHGEAARHMEASLALDPDNRMMIANLGVTRMEMGDPAKAMEILRHGLALPAGPLESALSNGVPTLTVKMRGDLAVALDQLGVVEESVAQCELALRDDPDNVDAHTTLGNIRQQQGRFDDAIRHYRAILSRTPDDALILSNLGVALARTGRLDEAIAAHRKAIAIIPDSADFHMNAGAALMMAKRTDEALDAFRAAVRLSPGGKAPLMSLASALMYVKKDEEALRAYGQIPAGERSPDVVLNIATLCDRLERRDEAIAAYRQALELARKGGDAALAAAIEQRLTPPAAPKP